MSKRKFSHVAADVAIKLFIGFLATLVAVCSIALIAGLIMNPGEFNNISFGIYG